MSAASPHLTPATIGNRQTAPLHLRRLPYPPASLSPAPPHQSSRHHLCLGCLTPDPVSAWFGGGRRARGEVGEDRELTLMKTAMAGRQRELRGVHLVVNGGHRGMGAWRGRLGDAALPVSAPGVSRGRCEAEGADGEGSVEVATEIYDRR